MYLKKQLLMILAVTLTACVSQTKETTSWVTSCKVDFIGKFTRDYDSVSDGSEVTISLTFSADNIPEYLGPFAKQARFSADSSNNSFSLLIEGIPAVQAKIDTVQITNIDVTDSIIISLKDITGNVGSIDQSNKKLSINLNDYHFETENSGPLSSIYIPINDGEWIGLDTSRSMMLARYTGVEPGSDHISFNAPIVSCSTST